MEIKIFTDGASRGNPGPGGWGAIVVNDDGDKQPTTHNKQKVQELGGREVKTTNNRMELTAVIEALVFASKLKAESYKLKAAIFTDSSYVLKGAKEWLKVWQKNNWKTKNKKSVLNQDLWEKYAEVAERWEINWKLLPGHAGIPANERCDEIATKFADNLKPKLYSGSLEKYQIDLSTKTHNLQPTTNKTDSRKLKAKTSSKKPYSYVSLVKGVVKIHATWAECEKRVKGVSGAKFKKSFSPEDEKAIIASWKP